jgi:N-acetylglucosamine kinase-like BadF-type ATPase
MNAAGERWQSGGWGHLISDEGSSYWFGWNAIRLAMGAYDGRWQSSLLEPVKQRLGLQEMLDMHYRLYTQGISKAEIAALAPLVIAAAAGGDELALVLIEAGHGANWRRWWPQLPRATWAGKRTGCEVT